MDNQKDEDSRRMTSQVPDPLQGEGVVIGQCDEIHGYGGETSKAQVTNHEIELLCFRWAETIADIEAMEKVFGSSGSWEIRMQPYGLNRLEYFKQFVGAERVEEILTTARERAMKTAQKESQKDQLQSLYISYAMEDLLDENMWQHYDWRAYEAQAKARIPWGDLDSNIVPLVQALNNIPGCVTLGSCGGHDPTEHQGQAGKDEFFVLMLFTQDEEGWWALLRIANAIEGLKPKIYMCPVDNDGLLEFWLTAEGDPSNLARWLSDEQWKELSNYEDSE